MPRDAAEAAAHVADGCAASGCAGGLAACGHQADTPHPHHLAIVHPAAAAWYYSPYAPPKTESRPALTSMRHPRPPHPTPTPSAPTTVQMLHLTRALAKTYWYRPPNCVLAGCLVPRWEEPHPATDLHIWNSLPLLATIERSLQLEEAVCRSRGCTNSHHRTVHTCPAMELRQYTMPKKGDASRTCAKHGYGHRCGCVGVLVGGLSPSTFK